MLICPVCRNADMIVLEYAEIEIDYCLSCKGIWLDEGELELLLDSAPNRDLVNELFSTVEDHGHSEKPRKCPICKTKMNKVHAAFNDGKQVLVDICPRYHGIWFDNGELYEIVCHMTSGDTPVRDFLRSIFSRDTICNDNRG